MLSRGLFELRSQELREMCPTNQRAVSRKSASLNEGRRNAGHGSLTGPGPPAHLFLETDNQFNVLQLTSVLYLLLYVLRFCHF